MLRSQDMSLVMLYLNRDIAKQGIQHIGQNPSIHFLNLNRHLKLDQLPFNKEIRFLEKLLVRIKFLEGECKKSENHTESKIKSKDLEQDINKHYNRLTYLREIRRDTLEKIKTLREDMFVVEELESYIANNMPEGCENYKVNLDHVCFVISKDKKVMLESVLNYNLRRNACVYNNDKTIEVIENEKFYNISGYVIFTHGLNAVEKIDLLITSLGGRVISEKSISIGSIGLNDKINQVSRIFENNEGAIDSELQLITGKIEYWKYCVNKEMQIYITMNGLGFGKDSDNLVGQGFVLREDLKKIKSLCDYITKKYGYAHVDVLKHYSYKARIPDNDLCDTEEGKPNELESYRDFGYEMRESDSDIEVCVKSIREDESPVRIESKILSADREHSYKKNKDDKNEVHTKRDVSHLYSNGMRKKQKEHETERNHANENVENNNLNEECIDSENKTNDCLENDHKQIVENVNKYASEELDDSDQSGENKNLLNNSFYNGKSNSTPSIVAVDENKIQKLELPDFVVEKPETPPTYFYTNKLTQAFQDLNDVYGVPAYKEINPALFYIITFPFMFGVMFGDAGHGIMLLCISLYLIKYEKTLKIPEFAEQIFSGRYIMLFCALWSIFFGFLYSDFLSLSIPLFPSEFTRLGSDYEKDSSYTYPFGIDHTWHHKQNAPLFFNSLKMKMSIVLGFAHMLLGSILSLLNSRYKRDKVTMYCVVVPQTVAFVSFVGYLIFLIFFKWVSTENRQGLISVLVSMFTTPFTLENPMYPYQKEVQLFLCSNIIISFIWMLFSKPVCETMRIKRKRKAKGAMLVWDKDTDEGDELIEIWMHGVIETIEFGIGLVSNTSSYLRLWAISLAHAELTNVLHTMTIGSQGIIMKVIMFPVWAFFTVALLIGLEGLSSCLHALRLNWIEFNSKFYKGTGYPFRPLDFKANYEE